ncbi:hypothetical protein LZQ00_05765 [Sphingobacterium sp. SRCM116780]|uniref:hypothetical protein n=1 Tax=Sphingobacterium sp. SRCM116780 TaxID=2907623 RepID=UPI001F290E3B|nr:hypothetical protein [Sphingobacterium sp. SRCM116780]UIR57321.1 hypothetical protein LZQ00_05765 [Sphingobacterium sp. SRCM116780]
MKLEELTLEVLAERTLSQSDSKIFVDWAVQVLKLGYESENLFVLAGLDFDSTEEREEYFWKCAHDLNLNIEKTEEELLDQYALIIANKAIRKEISMEYAFCEMFKVTMESGYNYRYIAFYEINEDLDRLTYDDVVLFNPGLTLENANDFILEEFKIFVQMEDLKISKEDRDKCFCETCKNLNIPITKNKYQLKKPFKYVVWACGICGSEKLNYTNNHEVKRMIITDFNSNKR